MLFFFLHTRLQFDQAQPLFLKHIVPTFECGTVTVRLTCQLLHQKTPRSIQSHQTPLHISGWEFSYSFRGSWVFFFLSSKCNKKQQHELQPDEIYATIMLLKHSLLCLSQIIASVQMLLSYIT